MIDMKTRGINAGVPAPVDKYFSSAFKDSCNKDYCPANNSQESHNTK